MAVPGWGAMTDEQRHRWAELLDNLVGVLPPRAAGVVVDGVDGTAAVVADRLADTLLAAGRPCARLSDATPLADEDTWRGERTADTVAVADGPRWRAQPPGAGWDVVIWLRTARAAAGGAEPGTDVVVDLHDPAWPVIRSVTARLAGRTRWYVSESRAFFAARAATWDTKFGDDLPAYAAAVAEAALPPGGVVLDAGCGTGRALPVLRAAVGPAGAVLGLDLTPEMLRVARDRAGTAAAGLLLADARQLPLPDASVDAVFAAGLLTHLPDPTGGLRELARVTRPDGRLVLFHPSGRAALAARHGRRLRPDEPLAELPLRRATARTGWCLTRYDDPPHRFLALATRA
jgi:SAM-dependent methyltransferase